MPKTLNVLSNLRVDVDDITWATSGYSSAVHKHFIERCILDNYAMVTDGFRVEILDQTSYPGTFAVYNGVAFDRDGQIVNSEDDISRRVEETITGPSTTHYIEIEFLTEESDTDARGFWDPTYDNGTDTSGDTLPPGREFSQTVATRLTPSWKIVTNTTGFTYATTPDTIRIPVACLTLNSSSQITGGSTTPFRTVLLSTVAISGTSQKVRCADTRGMPDSFTLQLSPGHADVESVTVSANDRENGILTVSAATRAHPAGRRAVVADLTPAQFLPPRSATLLNDVPTTGDTEDARPRFFQGDEERGYLLQIDPQAADTTTDMRTDSQICSLKREVDFLAAQLREVKFGAQRAADVGKLAAPSSSFNTKNRYFDRSPGVLPSRVATVTVGDGTNTFGDFNTAQYGTAQLALAAAVAQLNSVGGGTLYIKKGTYSITAAHTLTADTIVVGDGRDLTVLSGTTTPVFVCSGSGVSLSLFDLTCQSPSGQTINTNGKFSADDCLLGGIYGDWTAGYLRNCTVASSVMAWNGTTLSGVTFTGCTFTTILSTFSGTDISNCTFSGCAATVSSAGEVIRAGGDISKVAIINCTWAAGGAFAAITATDDIDRLTIDNCVLSGQTGLYAGDQLTNTCIENTSITASGADALHGATVSRVNVVNTVLAGVVGFSCTTATDVDFTNCSVSGSSGNGLSVGTLTRVKFRGTTISGIVGVSCSNAILDSSIDSCSITGTAGRGVFVNSSVLGMCISGLSCVNTAITGTTSGFATTKAFEKAQFIGVVFTAPCAFTMSSSTSIYNSKFDNCKFLGDGNNRVFYVDELSYCEIDNCLFSNSTSSGTSNSVLYVTTASNTKFHNCVFTVSGTALDAVNMTIITDCELSRCTAISTASGSSAVVLSATSKTVIRGLTAIAPSGGGSALSFQNPTDTLIDSCNLSFGNNGGEGINTSFASTRLTVRGCTFEQSGIPTSTNSHGVVISADSVDVSILGNSFVNTDVSVRAFGSSNLSICDNNIRCNTGYGLYGILLSQTAGKDFLNTCISGNKITGLSKGLANPVGIHTKADPAASAIRGLNIVNNTIGQLKPGSIYAAGIDIQDMLTPAHAINVSSNTVAEFVSGTGSNMGIRVLSNTELTDVSVANNNIVTDASNSSGVVLTLTPLYRVIASVTGNTIYTGIAALGVHVDTSNCVDNISGFLSIVGNSVYNATTGVTVAGPSAVAGKELSGVSIVGNTIQASTYGVFVTDLDSSTVGNNAITTTGTSSLPSGRACISTKMNRGTISGNSCILKDSVNAASACIDASDPAYETNAITGNFCRYADAGGTYVSHGIITQDETAGGAKPNYITGNIVMGGGVGTRGVGGQAIAYLNGGTYYNETSYTRALKQTDFTSFPSPASEDPGSTWPVDCGLNIRTE